MIKGVDVSVHNGSIDWKKAREAGMEFAIIRAGYGKEISQKDERFDSNMEGALKAGLQTGAYWFSYALDPKEARQEAQVCLKVLEPYGAKLRFPVFYDFEYASEAYAKKKGYTFTNAQRTDILLAFMEEIKKKYPTGYYTNRDYLTYRLDTKRLESWPLWLADYQSSPFRECDVQQTSSTGKIPGFSGPVDLNTAYETQWSKPAEPEKPQQPQPPEQPEKPQPAGTYTVRSGDTLSGIAKTVGVSLETLLRWNPQIKDPSLIYPGQVLRIEEAQTPSSVYTVRSGDTLSGIAARFGTTLYALLRLNPQIQDPNRIYPGQIIRVS